MAESGYFETQTSILTTNAWIVTSEKFKLYALPSIICGAIKIWPSFVRIFLHFGIKKQSGYRSQFPFLVCSAFCRHFSSEKVYLVFSEMGHILQTISE